MRAILLSTFLALLIGLAMPAAPAKAAAGDYDFGTGYAHGGHSYGHRYRYYAPRYRYRYHRPRRGYGVYFHYAPRVRPRRYHRTYRSRGNRCGYWSRRCAANWGYGGKNFRGCMRYHRC